MNGNINTSPGLGDGHLETVYSPEKVKEILNWLESHTSWGSGKSLDEYTIGSPDDITKEDVQEAFLEMKVNTEPNQEYDIRGHYLTALANKVLENDQDTIELTRPDTGEYDFFGNLGSCWERGKLILKGNFYREEVGAYMVGGKILVQSSVASRSGALMSGGLLEIMGNAGYGAGFGMTGGEILIHGNAGANVGDRMHGGTIVVDGKVGPNWNEYGRTDGPNIGIYKTGGKIIVDGVEY